MQTEVSRGRLRAQTELGAEPIWQPGELGALAKRLRDAGNVTFRECLEIAGLDPICDLRGGDWSDVSFDKQDLRGFDFTGADLTGCSFQGALVQGMITEDATLDDHALDGALTDSVSELANAMRTYPFFSEMFGAANAPFALMETLKKASSRGYLTPDELVRIIHTKNARSPGAKKNLTEAIANEENAVRRATEAALASSSPEQAITPLLDLKGVKVATASVILSSCKPETWPVIDQRALGALVTFGLLAHRPEGQVPQLDEWPRFVELVTALSKDLGWPPQRVDRWLNAFDKCQLTSKQLLGKSG